MNKKGFTLVELMVVIVIIGVLAAVAIPKMMAATNKAKAGEGPQILRSIGSMEAAYKAENDVYVSASQGEQGPADAQWAPLGFDQNPFSRYFKFDVDASNDGASFTASAALKVSLGDAKTDDYLTLTESDARAASSGIGKLVPNWK